jgi:spermidine synthase
MAERLFSDEFQKLMVRALVPGGAAATQCEQPFFDMELIKTIYQSAKALTKKPAYYYANIPTYPSGLWTFTIGSKIYDPLQVPEERFKEIDTKYYTDEIHRACFALPKFVKDLTKE